MCCYDHYKELGTKAFCMLRLAKCGLYTHLDDVSEVVLGNSWFRTVKTVVVKDRARFECIVQVKQNHSLYPKEIIIYVL